MDIENSSDSLQSVALSNLLVCVRDQLKALWKSERSRKWRWEKKSARATFVKNLFTAGKHMLDSRCNASLEVDGCVLNAHKLELVSDSHCDEELCNMEGMPPPPAIGVKPKAFSFSEDLFMEVLNSRKNGSAPGVNVVSYSVLVLCASSRIYSVVFL